MLKHSMGSPRAAPFIAAVCAVLISIPSAVSPSSGEETEKKGIALFRDAGDPSSMIDELDVSWYYNWGARPTEKVPVEFVPMVWGTGKRYFAQRMAFLQESAPHEVVLGFNEPDLDGQADMTVNEAVMRWRELETLATRVGSPAAANALGPWMRNFMERAAEDGLRVDFIAVHWYGPPNPSGFLGFVDRVHQTYRKPIWVTEFAVADWDWEDYGANRYSEWQVLCFLRHVLPELEARPFIERYAWFGSRTGRAARTSDVFDAAGELTAVGQFYADYDGGPSTVPAQAPRRPCLPAQLPASP